MPTVDLAEILGSYGFSFDGTKYVRDGIVAQIQNVEIDDDDTGGAVTGGVNIGVGLGDVFKQVTGTDLEFRTLRAIKTGFGFGGLKIETVTNEVNFYLRIQETKSATEGILEQFDMGLSTEYVGVSLASSLHAGVMTPADFDKLAALPAGATDTLQAAYDASSGDNYEIEILGTGTLTIKGDSTSPLIGGTIFTVADGDTNLLFEVTDVVVRSAVAFQMLAGGAVIGDLTVTGNVDGRDVSVDGAALDAHIVDLANPHATTLQKAYDSSASISMSGAANPVQLNASVSSTAYLRLYDRSATLIFDFDDAGFTILDVGLFITDCDIQFSGGGLNMGTGLIDTEGGDIFMGGGTLDMGGPVSPSTPGEIINVDKITGLPYTVVGNLVDFPSGTVNVGQRIGESWSGNYAFASICTWGYYDIVKGSMVNHAIVQTVAGATAVNAASGTTLSLTNAGGSLVGGTDCITLSATLVDCHLPLMLDNGTSINEFSIDDTLAGDSDDAVPTEQAVKAYVDAAVASIDDTVVQITHGSPSPWTGTTLDVVLNDIQEAGGSAAMLRRNGSNNAGTKVRGWIDTTDNSTRGVIPEDMTLDILVGSGYMLGGSSVGTYTFRIGLVTFVNIGSSNSVDTYYPAASATAIENEKIQFGAVGSRLTPLASISAVGGPKSFSVYIENDSGSPGASGSDNTHGTVGYIIRPT